MISQRDSKVNQETSNTSSDIARATKADGAAMKTIAFVTLTFLPATFVTVRRCSQADLEVYPNPIANSDAQLLGTPRYELFQCRLELHRRTSKDVERPLDLFRHRGATHYRRLVRLVVVAEERGEEREQDEA